MLVYIIYTVQHYFYMYDLICRRWGSGTTTISGSTTTRSQPAYSRMQRTVHVSRGRRSGVIVGSRPLVPASVVPEDLISQVLIPPDLFI